MVCGSRPRGMLSMLVLLLVTLSFCTPGARAADPASPAPAPHEFDPKGSDPKALDVVDQAMHALGMPGSWRSARYIEFSFGQARGDSLLGPPRRHCWDTWTNRYRLEGTARAVGKRYVILFTDVNDPKTAKVWLEGQLQTEDTTVTKFATSGHGAFINDTYWLLMPYKMKDPGVHLGWAGMQHDSASGRELETVELSFDNVGLTPKDHYMVSLDPATHMVVKWKYINGANPSQTMVTRWQDWKDVGPLKLSERRPIEGAPISIVFRDVTVSSEVKEAAFTTP
ncbi:MAG: hypothetical protein HZB25_06635 [Candidatus Eisenbacteria bacterium]|nr:hypothetical protein [Candidatus Eisenbacteria bacterium]